MKRTTETMRERASVLSRFEPAVSMFSFVALFCFGVAFFFASVLVLKKASA